MSSIDSPSPAAVAPQERRGAFARLTLTQWIVVAMVVGILLGWLFPESVRTAAKAAGDNSYHFVATDLRPLSNIFLRLIKSLIVPLLFSTLVVGIAGHGDDMKKVGRLAFRSIVYFEIVTTLALVVGLLAVNLARPGAGVTLGTGSTEELAQYASRTPTFGAILEHAVPESFSKSAAENDVLQIVVFAIIFAASLARVPAKPKAFMLAFCESLSEVMFKYVGIVMAFAPIGIAAAIAVTVGRSGIGVLFSLGKLVGTLYLALIVFVLGVLLPVAMIFRVPLVAFFRAVREPFLIAFSSASSEAALPRAMQNMEALGVPRRIVAFVLPTGYSFNLDGSTLYLALASVFAAQAAGIDMPIRTQLLMMLTLMLTSKGVAAVPRASLVILSGALTTFGLPLQAVAVILGVDALMDMARTSVNLLGNCLATVVMSRWEGEFGQRAVPEADRLAGEPLTMPVVEREAGRV